MQVPRKARSALGGEVGGAVSLPMRRRIRLCPATTPQCARPPASGHKAISNTTNCPSVSRSDDLRTDEVYLRIAVLKASRFAAENRNTFNVKATLLHEQE